MDKQAQLQRALQQAQDRIAELEGQLRQIGSAPISAQRNSQLWMQQVLKQLSEAESIDALTPLFAQLGEHLGLDDCLLLVHKQPLTALTLSWQRKNLPQQLKQLSQLDFLGLSQVSQQKSATKLVAIGDAQATTSENSALRNQLQKLGIGACLVVFIERPKQPLQSLLLVQRAKPRSWSDDELNLATTFSQALVLAYQYHRLHSAKSIHEQRFQYAMAASRDGIWDWNLTSNDVYFSDSYYRMLGYAPGEIAATVESFCNDIVHPEDLPKFLTFTTFTRKNRSLDTQLAPREIRLRHKDGHTLWCFVRAKAIDFDAKGLPTRIIGVNSDITHFKAVQQELLVAKTMADSANQTKGEFLTRMSHEIRTPMNAVIGMGHLLQDTSLNKVQRSYLENIDQAASSLLVLIDEILDFSKIEDGSIVLDSVHFDLHKMLEKMAKKTILAAEHKGLEIVHSIGKDVPRFLKGDALRLKQALFNIVDNAIKFSNRGNIELEISLNKDEKEYIELLFSVTDSGIGMSQQLIRDLFTAFQQADVTTRRKVGGAGLGLTISKYLIELMQGKISVNSKPGEGTKIEFTARFAHSQIGSLPIRDDSRKLKNIRVLVVDDNNGALEILASVASQLQLTVSTASSAMEAYALIDQGNSENKPIDLILMDYKMPNIDGIEASKFIKQNKEKPPTIILVSAYRKDEIFEGKKPTYIDGFISKPASHSRLFDAIAEVYGNKAFIMNNIHLEEELIARALNNSHVLLAEDNIVNRKVAIGILHKVGVTVTVAVNGQEAIDQVNNNPAGTFSAILMDMEMPEVDGFDATRAIRSGNHCPNIPIIALTAHAMRGDKERCLSAGMNDYLTKPIKPELLFTTLANHIGNHLEKKTVR